MENRRRAFSNTIDGNTIDNDIEKQIARRRNTSVSIDDILDNYTEYVYNSIYNFTKICLRGILNLIYSVCRRR
jgi:hypothetical protein